MTNLVAFLGFIALLALASAGLLTWLVTRLTDRVVWLEREAHELAGQCRTLQQSLDALSTGLGASAPPEASPVPVLAGVDTGINLSKRVQILRLSRRGESSPHIASVLNIPLAQVELVLKLQRHVAESPLVNQ